MDINFDQFGHGRQVDTIRNSGCSGHLDGTGPLDWAGLAARMAAAQAARQILTETASHISGPTPGCQADRRSAAQAARPRASGSFAPAVAPRVSAYLANAG